MDPLGLLTVSGLNGWLVIVTWNAVTEFITVSFLEAKLRTVSLATLSNLWFIIILSHLNGWYVCFSVNAPTELVTVGTREAILIWLSLSALSVVIVILL